MTSTSAVTDFRVLIPPGWVRLPLDAQAPLRVKNLVTGRIGAVPVAKRAELRSALTREVTAVLTTAARQGGIDVLLSLDSVAGRPVPASGLITHLEGRGDGDPLDALMGMLGASERVRELGVVEVAGGPAVRRLTSRRERLPDTDDDPGGVLTVTQVDYFVPLPGANGLLVLTFSTPIEQLAPPLVQLFDVISGSLRWVRS